MMADPVAAALPQDVDRAELAISFMVCRLVRPSVVVGAIRKATILKYSHRCSHRKLCLPSGRQCAPSLRARPAAQNNYVFAVVDVALVPAEPTLI